MHGRVGVVGGGVIGMAVAWRVATAGWSVTVYDRAPMSSASWVAGGMLAPLSEGWPGEGTVLDFGAAALARWPDFVCRLSRATGESPLCAEGVLTAALDDADVVDLRTVAEWVVAQGYGVQVCDRSRVRALEPSLSRSVRLGLLATGELAVDNRRLLTALRRAGEAAGVRFVAEDITDLVGMFDDVVVLAAGYRCVELWPTLPVRPVKGEILRLKSRRTSIAPPCRVVRARVHGRPVYLVPRADGLVVGATQYESAERVATVAGVRDLLADAEELFAGVGEYELAEASAGVRPMTPDNLPMLGWLTDRIYAATGHGRNGLLAAPLTAEAVLAGLSGDDLADAKSARPQRFIEGA